MSTGRETVEIGKPVTYLGDGNRKGTTAKIRGWKRQTFGGPISSFEIEFADGHTEDAPPDHISQT